MLEYKIVICPDKAIQDYYARLDFHYDGDVGLDLAIPWEYHITAGQSGIAQCIDHGVKIAVFAVLSDQELPIHWFLMPRSSLSKTPLRLANSVGLIDAQYRGNVLAYVDNISERISAGLHKGQRLFQLVLPTPSISTEIVLQDTRAWDQNYAGTERGTQGFGSTDK